MAIEVVTGEHVRFIELDLNTGRGRVEIDGTTFGLVSFYAREDMLHFSLAPRGGWNIAHFDGGEVRVIDETYPCKRGHHTMWWVGQSATKRRQEPLYPKDVEHCAQVQGLSEEEYLRSQE